MNRSRIEEVALGLLALGAAAVSPIIFPAAQAGLARMSVLAVRLLVPSIVLLVAVAVAAVLRGHRRVARRMIAGAACGAAATLGLEAIRLPSFLLGGMPGDLPRLMGVLLADRFMLGPSTLSDVLGYAYHFWNGASFGLIFAVLFGRASWRWTSIYGLAIGLGFLAGPAVRAMGVGFLGLQMPTMTATVVVAHLGYGLLLGLCLRRSILEAGGLQVRRKQSRELTSTATQAA
ncbi:MAG TPA: hypothetical protein VKS03_09365 [Thermoanaerobaculia bacterium]|nr:hypothetical protein [Thermoanaerobaculia bacterium]